MDINYDELLQTLNANFPSIPFIFCYGSAAFPQSGYNYSTETPMIDLIFVVEDYYEWHYQNFLMNKSHYSGLGYVFGPSFLAFLEKNFVPIHYNPYVKISRYSMKYGVVSISEMINSLNSWGNLVLAGRMHKPVKILKNSSVLYTDTINNAIQANYLNALSLSFLLNFEQFIPENRLFNTICSLSYIGDIRMVLGLEKNDKIKGIVDKQEGLFREIYGEIIRKSSLKAIVKYRENEKIYEICDIIEGRNRFIENIPYEIGMRYTGVNKDYKEILKEKKTAEIQDHIIKSLKMNNLNYSIRLIMYHFLTTSFKKNFVYTLAKLKKRFK